MALWFKYDGSPGDFATKFGDYISIRKFIWTFSVKGEVTDYINTHQIGKVFYRSDKDLKTTIYEALINLVENPDQHKFNPSYDFNRLRIENLTNELIKALQA